MIVYMVCLKEFSKGGWKAPASIMNYLVGEPEEVHVALRVCYYFLCTFVLADPKPVKANVHILQEEYIHARVDTKVKTDNFIGSQLIQEYWDDFYLFLDL